MTSALFTRLNELEVEYTEQYEMSRISYIGIGGIASVFAQPNSSRKLIKLVDFLTDEKIKYKVVGAMTNLLPSDSGFDGVLISTNKISTYSVAENILFAECGVKLSRAIKEIAALSLGGLSELYGIPGSVGGMVYGNAGAYGKEISDVILDARLYSPTERRLVDLDAAELSFSYRKSKLQDTDLILISARFKLSVIDEKLIKTHLDSIINMRRTSQPYGERSLGSVFKRCDGAPISRLIDELGFKGYRVGGATVSQKHAGFIVNSESATSADVKKLIEIIKERLLSVHKIKAEEEIEYLE